MAYGGSTGTDGHKDGAFYLLSNMQSWLMSPYLMDETQSIVRIFLLCGSGRMDNNAANVTSNNNGLLPAISLIAEAKISQGTGLYNDPYIINTTN